MIAHRRRNQGGGQVAWAPPNAIIKGAGPPPNIWDVVLSKPVNN